MFNFHKDHRALVYTSFIVFASLSFFIAVLPAWKLSHNTDPLPEQKEMTDEEREGLHVFISEGCVACHTQQVRSIEMDAVWGDRPSMPSDYYYSKQRMGFWQQSPSLLGSERTGPDLTNAGLRQGAETWHFLHLYNPRSVVAGSVMPAYPWLFKEVDAVAPGNMAIQVPASYAPRNGKHVIVTQKARYLVAYLLSLKQTPVPDAKTFVPSKKTEKEGNGGPDGQALYTSTCAPCHQASGEGITGAFPPLKGSEIVLDENPDRMIKIILMGYDARPDYGVMTGFGQMLSNEEIAAIMNHERSSWGNSARPVTPEQIETIRKALENEN